MTNEQMSDCVQLNPWNIAWSLKRRQLLHSPSPLGDVDGVLHVEEVLGHLLAQPLPLDLPPAHLAVHVRPGCRLLVPARVCLELARVGEAGLARQACVENGGWPETSWWPWSILLWPWWSWLMGGVDGQ